MARAVEVRKVNEMMATHTNRPATRRILGIVAAISISLVAYGSPVQASTGPYLVKNINPGFEDSTPRWLTNMDGTLYFGARGGTKGRELWRSDGTSGGTTRVKDIRTGTPGSDPQSLAAVAGLLYFSADDGLNGRELWVSDGTGPGTRLVKDINPGAVGSNPTSFTRLKGHVYFSADDGSTGRELWRTDGTSAGTKRVKDMKPGPEGSEPATLVPFDGKLFFLGACSPSCTYFGVQTLYRSDGTAAGTRPFRNDGGEIVTGSIWQLRAVGSRMFFGFMSEAEDVARLWRTKGTAASTRPIAEIWPEEIANVDGTAFIEAGGLWTSDGTAVGTNLVKELRTFSGFLFAPIGDRLFFEGESNDWFHALWVSDGTTQGTQPLASAFTLTREWAAIGPTLYFANQVDDAYTLWRSDGTPDGTYSVGGQEAHMWDVTAVGNSIFWVSDAGDHGNELWRYVP